MLGKVCLGALFLIAAIAQPFEDVCQKNVDGDETCYLQSRVKEHVQSSDPCQTPQSKKECEDIADASENLTWDGTRSWEDRPSGCLQTIVDGHVNWNKVSGDGSNPAQVPLCSLNTPPPTQPCSSETLQHVGCSVDGWDGSVDCCPGHQCVKDDPFMWRSKTCAKLGEEGDWCSSGWYECAESLECSEYNGPSYKGGKCEKNWWDFYTYYYWTCQPNCTDPGKIVPVEHRRRRS